MNASKSQTHFFGIPKLPARCASVVMPFLLSAFMSGIVSMISTLRGIGPSPDFLGVWLGAWGMSWVIAFPTVLLVLPVVRRATMAIVRSA
jgi:hypothetical protein